MSSPVLAELQAQVEASTQIEASAVILINGIVDRIKAAVLAALENGATAAELKPVQDEILALKQSSTALSDAITANTTPTEG